MNSSSSNSNAENTNPGASSNPGSTSDSNQQRGWDAVVAYVTNNKIDFILAITRALTVLCTISYLTGIPGPAPNRFKQALLLSAATSSLRLHQRMPPPPLRQLNRNYLISLVMEDSFHYLIFPFMFFTSGPIALALLPCSLYALFNLAVYAMKILDKLGNQEALRLKVSELVTKYQQSLLHTIAMSEVALMPVIVIGVFTQVVSILMPIFYYRFLHLRYNSVRNAHFKLLVSQIMTFVSAQTSRYMSS